jgi:hypothetical protein
MIGRLALCLWLLPTLAAAQSHPCDGPYPSDGGTLQEGPYTLRWCFSELDRRGTPTTVTAWAVYSSGTREVLQASEVTAGTANAFGLRLYSAPVVVDVVDTPPRWRLRRSTRLARGRARRRSRSRSRRPRTCRVRR